MSLKSVFLATTFVLSLSAAQADYKAEIKASIEEGFADGEKCIEIANKDAGYLLRINLSGLVRAGLFKPAADWDPQDSPYEMIAKPSSEIVESSLRPHPKAKQLTLLCYGKPTLIALHSMTKPVKWRRGLMASVVSYTSSDFQLAPWANNIELRGITPEWDEALEQGGPTKRVEKFVRTDIGWLRWETYRNMEK